MMQYILGALSVLVILLIFLTNDLYSKVKKLIEAGVHAERVFLNHEDHLKRIIDFQKQQIELNNSIVKSLEELHTRNTIMDTLNIYHGEIGEA